MTWYQSRIHGAGSVGDLNHGWESSQWSFHNDCIMKPVFKLDTPAMAILDENHQPKVIIIPANAVLTIMSGDVDGIGLLEVRYENQTLKMLPMDLRNAAQAVMDDSV
jgi:hypothetical protein